MIAKNKYEQKDLQLIGSISNNVESLLFGKATFAIFFLLTSTLFFSCIYADWSIPSAATLIYPYDLTTNTYIISAPGVYILVSDIIFTPFTPQPAFYIQASGVQLDLNQRMLAQYTPTPDCVGIYLAPGLSGVQVKNGTVYGFTGTAVSVNTADQFFLISDIDFHACSQCVLDFAGTTSDYPIVSGIVENITMTQCTTNAVSSAVVNANYVSNLLFQNVVINQCGVLPDSLSGFNFANALNCQLLYTSVIASQGQSEFIAYNLSACTNLIAAFAKVINNCAIPLGTDFTGFLLTNKTTSGLFSNCILVDNATNGGNFIGIDIQDYCTGNIFDSIQMAENQGDGCIGFSFESAETPSQNNNNIITNSSVIGSSALAEDFVGILINNSDDGIISSTKIGNNNAAYGNASGILFQSGTGGSYWAVNSCEIFKNIGSSDADSYGIWNVTGTGNFFMKNVSYQNGSVLANQLTGVPSGSISLVDPTNLNSVMSPWTNIGVAS